MCWLEEPDQAGRTCHEGPKNHLGPPGKNGPFFEPWGMPRSTMADWGGAPHIDPGSSSSSPERR